MAAEPPWGDDAPSSRRGCGGKMRYPHRLWWTPPEGRSHPRMREVEMLASAPVEPTMPVVDMERAKGFYGQTLGLKFVEESEAGVSFECGNGSRLTLYPRGPTKADHTVAGFRVQDVEAEVRELRAKGVVFEEYDFPGLKTVNGIATIGNVTGAWFKDSEENILGLAAFS